jgi:capsular polysaccharide biosynthesis protein
MMRRGAQSLVRLYPATWRARYGEEFATVIEDSPAGWRSTFDVMKGAIRMQLHVPTFPKLAVILSMLGLVTGLVASMFVTPRYVSHAEMQLVDRRANAPAAGPRPVIPEYLTQLKEEILSRTSLSAIIQDPRLDLYADQRSRVPLEDTIQQVRADVEVSTQYSGSNYAGFVVTFAYSEPEKARDTVEALVTKFVDSNAVRQRTMAQMRRMQPSDEIGRLEARIAALEKKLGIKRSLNETYVEIAQSTFGDDGIKVSVLDPPILPTNPVYPDRWQFMAIGFGAGFAMAVVIAALRRRTPIPFQPVQAA